MVNWEWDSFPKYVAAYISRLVLNLVSFLVTFLLAIIIVKALMFAVNIIGELPVLGLVNHIAGGVLGLVLAFVIVWIGFLVMTLAYTTGPGMACFEMVEKSPYSSVFVRYESAYDQIIRILNEIY